MVITAGAVSFLRALQGLWTPHDIHGRFGALEELTLATSEKHTVRDAIEGVGFRMRAMIEQLYLDSPLPRPATLRMDGGASENDFWMQIQSNVLGCPIERMEPVEAMAYGTALLAGEAFGIWEPCSSASLHPIDKIFELQWGDSERAERSGHWKSVFGL